MTTSTAPVKVPCPKVVKPTADDLEKIIIFIGNQYGWEYIKPLEELLGAFPLSHSWDGITLDIPELEWEGKVQAIIEEFKLYPLVFIAEKFSSIIPIPLVVVEPITGITVDVKQLITDPDYKGKLLTEFQEAGDEIIDLLVPDFVLENWDGTDGIDAPAIKMSKAWKEFVAKVKELFQGNIFATLAKILKDSALETVIETIKAAGKPFTEYLDLLISLPGMVVNGGKLDFDTDAFLMGLKKQFKEAGKDFQEELLAYPLPVVSEIAGSAELVGLDLPETLGDLIDLEEIGEFKKVDFPNWNIDKLRDRIDNFIRNLPQMLLEAVLEKLSDYIGILIPSGIPIPFTLCSFLEFLGFPKEISVSNLVLEGT